MMGDRHEPAADVAVRAQAGVRPHGGQERLGPRVIGVGRTDHREADPQHDGPVAFDDDLERRLGRHVPSDATRSGSAKAALRSWIK